MSQTYVEDTTPRRGAKASINDAVGDHYVLDSAAPAGVLVVPAAVGHCDLPASAADVAKALGALVYDPVQEPATVAGNDFDAAAAVEVCDSYQLWCVTEDTLTVGAQPYARHTANGAGKLQLGAFRSDADTDNAALVPNARVVAVYGTTLAKIKFNLPHGAAA